MVRALAGADRPRRGQAVHHGHVHVHDDQVEALLARSLDGDLTVFGGGAAVAGGAHPGLEDHAVDRVVLDHQHAQRLPVLDLGVDRFRGGLTGPFDHIGLDREGEGGAFAEGRHHADVAVHDVGHAPRNRQAQPRAAEPARRGRVDLGEGLEQPRQIVRGDAGAGIGDGEVEAHTAVFQPLAANDVRNLALVGELHRIGEQVMNDLADAQRIAAHDSRNVALEPGVEVQPLGFGLGLEGPGHPLVEILERHVDDLEGHLAGLDLGHVEDVVQQAQQIVAGVADDRQIVPLRRLQPRGGQQLGGAEDAVHRGAQFMRNDAEEVGLGVAGGIGLVARGLQLLDQMGLMLLEGADPLLPQHGHHDQHHETRARQRQDRQEGPEERAAPHADEDDRGRDAVRRGDDERLPGRGAQLREHQNIAADQQGRGEGGAEWMAGIPGDQGRGGPGGGGRGRDSREYETPAGADPIADALLDRAADGAGGDGSYEPQGRTGETHRREQAERPGADDHIAEVLGLENRTQGLSGLAGSGLAAGRLADAVGFNHCVQTPR